MWIERVCRLCAQISEVIPIFDNTITDYRVCMATKIKKCIPILVTEQDLKPKNICLTCASKLQEFTDFIETCQAADFKFDSILYGPTTRWNHKQNDVTNGLNIEQNETDQENGSVVLLEKVNESIANQNILLMVELKYPKEVREPTSNIIDTKLNVEKSENAFDSIKTVNYIETQKAVDIQYNNNALDNISERDIIFNQKIGTEKGTEYLHQQTVFRNGDSKIDNTSYSIQLNNLDSPRITSNDNFNDTNNSFCDKIFLGYDEPTENDRSNKIASDLKTADPLLQKSNHIMFNKNAIQKSVSNNLQLGKKSRPDKNLEYSSSSVNVDVLENINNQSNFNCSLNVPNIENVFYTNYNQTKTVSQETCIVKPKVSTQVKELKSHPHKNIVEENYFTLTQSGIKTDDKSVATKVKRFSCTVCQKTFMRRTNLNIHMSLHTKVRPFKCPECPKNFATKYDMSVHQRLHSGEFSCEVCGKAFLSKCKLERHRRVHTGEKPFVCEICSKCFADKRNLTVHIEMHKESRNFACGLCSKTFRSKSHLVDHQKVHSTDAPYQCDICDKCFKWKNNLFLHIKAHKGEKYPCDLCNKQFSREARLKKHKHIHTAIKNDNCAEIT